MTTNHLVEMSLPSESIPRWRGLVNQANKPGGGPEAVKAAFELAGSVMAFLDWNHDHRGTEKPRLPSRRRDSTMKSHDVTFAVTVGPWAGFHIYRGWAKRLCLGWVAVTYFHADFPELVTNP